MSSANATLVNGIWHTWHTFLAKTTHDGTIVEAVYECVSEGHQLRAYFALFYYCEVIQSVVLGCSSNAF